MRLLYGWALGVWAAGAAAQEPPCAALPEAGRSCVDLIVVDPALGTLGRTGISRFDADNEPGHDSGAQNHVVRTLDLLVYELRYRVLHQSATDTMVQFTLPAGVQFADPPRSDLGGAPIPAWCGAGSTISGQILSCMLGSVAEGTTRSVTVQARPAYTTPDGSVLRVMAAISASNQQSTGAVQRLGYQDPLSQQSVDCSETRLGTLVSLSPCGDIVSAQARFDLEFSGYASTNLLDRGARGPQILRAALASTLTTVVGGPAGRRGFVVAYPLAIALPGDGVGGAPLPGVAPFTLTQRLRNSDGLAGFGELVGCGINGNLQAPPGGTLMPAGWAIGSSAPETLRAIFHPYGSVGLGGGTAENAAHDSGQLSCTQSVAGGDISLQLTPAADTFAPPGFPTRQVDGQVVPRRYVFVGLVVVFYPADPVLLPEQGGNGDGSVTVRHDIGVLQGNALRGLALGGVDEPDAAAINDGLGGVQTYDDDHNNFSIATLDAGFGRYQKTWRNPRLDTLYQGFPYCLKDSGDPTCRHGHTFPGSQLLAEFLYTNTGFDQPTNARFCDEWDASRSLLRRPFDPLADPSEMPPDAALVLDLDGANASPEVLNAAGFTVEVSTSVGTVPNIDWFPTEPARTDARSQLSAPECSSGSWVAASLPPVLVQGRQRIQLPVSLEDPPGSGRYPAVRRVRVRAQTLPPFVSVALRGSYEVMADVPGTRLPNRTSFALGNSTTWTYAENDHAIVRSVDTSIDMLATTNLTTGELAPLGALGFGEVVRTEIYTRFTSGEVNPPPATQPLIVRSYLPLSLDHVPGSAVPALHLPPYAGTHPETGQPATVLEWRLSGLRPGDPVPNLRYDAQLNFNATPNAAVHTTATVEHALDPSPLFETPIFASLEDRLATQDLTAEVEVGLLVAKSTPVPFIETQGTLVWDLQYANTSGAPFAQIRLVDVLPALGDPVNPGNAYSGGFSGGSVTPVRPGEYTIYSSSTAPALINRNPNCVSNGGTVPDGSGSCPASGATWTVRADGLLPAGTTAVRVDDADGLAASSSQSLRLQLATRDNRPGDVYENSTTAVAPGASLVLASTRSQVQVPGGVLRGAVYADLDGSGTPASSEPGIGDVLLTLTGTDTQGNVLEIETRTVSIAGVVQVDNQLRLNGGPPQTYPCAAPAPGRLRVGEFLLCRLPSADEAGYTLQETQPPDYLDRSETLGTLSSGNAPGVVGNDVFTGIGVRNNLLTGAAESGAGYTFGEVPQFSRVGGRVYREASVPTNVQDNDDPADPGLVTSIRLSCTPAYTGAPVQESTADGRFLYEQVPVGARCTLLQTQPAGYLNAYNLQGEGGVADTGSSGSGDSSITLVVPAGGSLGNRFAEWASTDTTSSIACTPAQPRPSDAVSCVATCINLGPTAALNMLCSVVNVAQLPNAQLVGCVGAPAVAVGGQRSCTVNFSMLTGQVVVQAGSGASNDSNGGSDPLAGNNPSRAPLGLPAVPAPLSPASLLFGLALLAGVGCRGLRRRT